MPPATTLLSPLANPFRPHFEEPYEIAIFNDGVPSMTTVDAHGEYDLLHGISDEAIDEQFPPTAEEAAEMEAAENFVEVMVRLAMMEEMEESARVNFDHVQKRWEARRMEGLVGKPNPPRNHEMDTERVLQKYGHIVRPNTDERIVPFEHRHRELAVASLEHRIRAKQEAKLAKHAPDKKLTGLRGRKPVQQPRKHY
mmetsp:Transcript_25608/g.36095  ORF Transcript_25608/g.36095 Transcript_25608/m.36095 type:complete len:197 (+) Transcript_25608:81-671(+)